MSKYNYTNEDKSSPGLALSIIALFTSLTLLLLTYWALPISADAPAPPADTSSASAPPVEAAKAPEASA